MQATPLLSDCESLNASVSRIWPVAVAKAALTAASAGLSGVSGGPTGELGCEGCIKPRSIRHFASLGGIVDRVAERVY